MSEMTFPKKMLLFGCGNMAGAMLNGWLAAGVAPSQFVVVDPVAQELPKGVKLYKSASEAKGKSDHLVIGIKPQMLGDLAGDIAGLLKPKATVLSMLAGVEVAHLQALFPDVSIVRMMPNLAVSIGQAPIGLCGCAVDGAMMDDAQRSLIDAILSPLGTPEWLESEDLMDAFTALAGSGPAFVYRFIDALAAGAVATGLPQQQAERIAQQMVLGSAQLAASADVSPGELARRVASPGGMTAKGLDVLDENATLAQLIRDTLRATRNRGSELAALARKDD